MSFGYCQQKGKAMAELVILGIVASMVAILYLIINPLFSGANMVKLAVNDACAFTLCLFAAGVRYLDKDVPFNLFGFELGWFWYTFIVYLAVATPAFIWYAKRYDVKF